MNTESRLLAALKRAAADLVTVSTCSNEPKVASQALAFARSATDAIEKIEDPIKAAEDKLSRLVDGEPFDPRVTVPRKNSY